MNIRKVARSITASKKLVKASKSVDEMLIAFEQKLSEFGVESSTRVECSTGDSEMDQIMENERAVEIFETDYDRHYEDVDGGFGLVGEIYSLADIKEYWNESNIGDPVLESYTSFEKWWNDTRSWMREV